MKTHSTRMDFALSLIRKKGAMSCQQITKAIIKKENLTGSKALYLPASISSKLANLVKKGVLRYAESKSEKGGHLYEINE